MKPGSSVRLHSPLPLAGALALALFGCHHEDSRAAPATVTAAPIPTGSRELGLENDPRADAPHEVGRALCERQLICDRLGPDRPYDGMRECAGDAVPAARAHLASLRCPSGFDEAALTTCEDAARGAVCDGRLDVLGGMRECTATAVCARARFETSTPGATR